MISHYHIVEQVIVVIEDNCSQTHDLMETLQGKGKEHNLMQAIARVNRVFKEKLGGVVVDYIETLESLTSVLK